MGSQSHQRRRSDRPQHRHRSYRRHRSIRRRRFGRLHVRPRRHVRRTHHRRRHQRSAHPVSARICQRCRRRVRPTQLELVSPPLLPARHRRRTHVDLVGHPGTDAVTPRDPRVAHPNRPRRPHRPRARRMARPDRLLHRRRQQRRRDHHRSGHRRHHPQRDNPPVRLRPHDQLSLLRTDQGHPRRRHCPVRRPARRSAGPQPRLGSRSRPDPMGGDRRTRR